MASFREESAGGEGPLDAETESLLQELWTTPVGRRWVLKAGLGSAVAMGVGFRGAATPAEGAVRRRSRRAESTDLHFALGHLRGVSRLELVVGEKRVRLSRHTKASREALRRRGGVWRAVDLSRLSHHVAGLGLPSDRGMLLSVHGKRGRHEVLVAHMWHVPRATTIRLARLSHRATGSFRHVAGSSRRLAALGLKPAQIRSAQHVAQLQTIGDQYLTAAGMVGLHPNIATKDPTSLGMTTQLLQATSAVTTLGQNIGRMQQAGKDVGQLVQAKNADGTPAQITIGNTTTTFSSLQLNPKNDPGFSRALPAAVRAGITGVRDTASLGAVINQPLDTQPPAVTTKTWVQPQGVIPQAQPYTRSLKAGAGLDIQVKNPGSLFGTQTQVNGAYNNGQVPLKLYNNYVRWVWVYVQYLGANNENLSANPNATWPDTKYSQSLGLLPQVGTVLGIPLFNTNTIDVTLNFPQGAHTARLLLCGLGNNAVDGSWRQYFPADAYLDSSGNQKIAPTDEVLFPALVTGIVTIGLTAFSLTSDVDIAAMWAAVNKQIGADAAGLSVELAEIFLTAAQRLTAAESLAVGVSAGGLTYESIKANGGSTENIWSILLALATVIPKILFTTFYNYAVLTRIGAALSGTYVGFRIAQLLPYIAEVLAILEAVGDAATLAEVCAETIMSPWVIENEVNLTYPATVTIKHDINDATFPVTARSWQLEAKVDGSVVLDSKTDSINQGGHIQSDDLVLSVTAPFGGNTIQWSVVFLDASGHQVGTGVSAQFPNNDPANPPSAVTITITEIPVTIDASTVFKRADTTVYSVAAGGYSWSDQVTDGGTVLGTGIQEVTGTTISTLAGVAGVVWEQDDRFYLRGVPVAQNGATISLGKATNEGWPRRPFLLFDAFVDRHADGNNVLLEPDGTLPAYHVRKVSLDPLTGTPEWDRSITYGTFALPVSAAALHSSGRIVAINTDSGRFGWLTPVATQRPVQAAYSAGPGTQVGLLSSPVAIAVTNPGVVLVLEAARSQIAAFDLNGNPVPYFTGAVTRRALVSQAGRTGGAGNAQYTLPLVSEGTYLDLAVDGAAQIYALYYTGDGSAPGDYRVDVYTAAGGLLDSHSPGVNVPHLAVDYWRSIYAANYDPLTEIATGKPRIDPALGVAEPSLSRFDPTPTTTRKPPKTHGPKHDTKQTHRSATRRK